ncbi:MAG: RNA 3'-terminal phosphate cyclase [Methylococcaceae bacterium]|nr:RNA 3'-terminal phosphate cyclase [Methylococcaceae bacterium]
MIEIDGSQGEGGGQILRTSLSLSACTGQAIHIRHIRQKRKKGGLMRQHLACVTSLARICNAHVKGASIGSKAVEFTPNNITGGEYHFSIGSAGSTMLVLQTVLPALLQANKPSKLILEGGTHNPLAPSFEFINHAFLPMLKKMGVECKTSIKRYGFFPVGAGHVEIEISPCSKLAPIKIEERGKLQAIEPVCIGAGIPAHVLNRESKQLLYKFTNPQPKVKTLMVDSLGSGNLVSIRLFYEHVNEVIDCLGAIGIRAEKVATNAITAMRKYQASKAPVGEHLADQLLLPMAIGSGGCFVTSELSEHTRTNIDVIESLTNVRIHKQKLANHLWKIIVDV